MSDETQIFDIGDRPVGERVAATPDGDDRHCDVAAEAAPITEAVRQWRVAEALLALRRQVNAAFPGRGTASDGTIGDPAHQSRKSDHNPWVVDGGVGVVTAMDVTHDPQHGCDAGALAEAVRGSRDARVKYVIWNRRIASAAPIGAAPAWAWRAYAGVNPHDHHCHLSVKPDKGLYDSAADWTIRAAREGAAVEPADAPFTEIRLALSAVGAAAAEGVLLEGLLDAQDAVAVLLARYAEAVRDEGGPPSATEARPSFDSLRADYARLWDGCALRPEHAGDLAFCLKRLRAGRPRYEVVAGAAGTPWWFVGIAHGLEASFSFAGHLHNGDPLTARTVQVPRGRPPRWLPPSDWESSAADALQVAGNAGQGDWDVPHALYRFEAYNGFGYHGRGVNSPYLWSFTNRYSRGKFVRDGHFDPDAVSRQTGAAAMLRALVDAGDVRV